jgi:large subunit ribosomal protein L10
MPNDQKIKLVAQIKEKVQGAAAVYLTDYRGLSVPRLQDLRKQLRTTNPACEFTVVKNTLLELALRQLDYPAPEDGGIEGPTAILICRDDAVGPLSLLARFAADQELPRLKGGFLGREWLPGNKVQRLAVLPSLATLRAQTVYSLAAPLAKLDHALTWPLMGLVRTLEEIRKQKRSSQGGETT